MQRRDGPRWLRNNDDDDDDEILIPVLSNMWSSKMPA